MWAAAVAHYTLPDRHPCTQLHWTSLLVSALWQFSKAFWGHRNEVVHGATIEEQAQRMIASLHQSTTAHYAAYHDNPNLVLAQHQHLFTTRTLVERLRAPMILWLHGIALLTRQ